MPGKRHAAHHQADALGQLHPHHRQGYGDAPARAQHGVEVAIVGVVVVVDVAAKVQVAVEELVQGTQPLQQCRVARQSAFKAGEQLVHVAQHLLHIQLGVFVLG